jgi:ABC-type phosphate transport system substrate-binding protein
MTRIKTLVAGLSLCAIVLVASNSFAAAPTILFNGAGSSAMFNTFAFAARIHTPNVCGMHNWSKKNGAATHDGRNASIPDVTGNIWIVWDDDVNPTKICAYLNIDSGIGVRSFFAVPTAIVTMPSSDIGSAGDQLVPAPMPPDEALPAVVYNALNNAAFNVAMTDIRPEDALFATNRALNPLTQDRSGLGYGPPPIGVPILSAFSGKSVVPVLFALSGTDPISGDPINFRYTTTSIGASPVVVFVNKTNTATGHLGSPVFTNVNRFVLSWVYNGMLSRTHDLTTTTGLPPVGIHTILREPLSGTYNTFEFNIPRSKEVASSQEIGVTPPADNPLNQTYHSGGSRQRAIGTGEMVQQVGNIADSLGYAFWGFGNFSPVVSTAKYLTVDGVDPIQASYTNGTFPTCSQPPCPGRLTFPNVKNGTYPAWSILRAVTVTPVPSGVGTLINAAIAESTQIPDFVPATGLTVFRSHYLQSGVAPHNGHKLGSPEAGGDMGGAVYTNQSDSDYVQDTGNEILGQIQ